MPESVVGALLKAYCDPTGAENAVGVLEESDKFVALRVPSCPAEVLIEMPVASTSGKRNESNAPYGAVGVAESIASQPLAMPSWRLDAPLNNTVALLSEEIDEVMVAVSTI